MAIILSGIYNHLNYFFFAAIFFIIYIFSLNMHYFPHYQSFVRREASVICSSRNFLK